MRSGIAEEHHEPHVHVILLVAVEERWAGVVSGEFNFQLGTGGDKDGVLHDTVRLGMALDAAKFEAVTVQMDRMVVGAAIFEEQAIALAGGEGRALSVGIGLAVDEPVVEVAVTGEFGFEDERDLDGFGFGRRRGVGELEIVPVEAGWLLPLRLAAAACVFDDDAHTSGLSALADFAESPDAGIVHLDNGADTLSG